MNKNQWAEPALIFGLATFLGIKCFLNPSVDYSIAVKNTSLELAKKMDPHWDINPTEEYSLIRINGKIYLTNCKSVSFQKGYLFDSVIEFTDVSNAKSVGYYIIPDRHKTNEGAYSHPDFAKEYGYQKLLPRAAIIPLSEFVKAEYPTESDLSFFASNSTELEKFILNQVASTKLTQEYYRDNCFSSKIDYNEYPLLEYALENKNQKFTLSGIGYRASMNEKDIGYNYIYDVISSNIVYIGKNRSDGYKLTTLKKVKDEKKISEWKKVISFNQRIPERRDMLEEVRNKLISLNPTLKLERPNVEMATKSNVTNKSQSYKSSTVYPAKDLYIYDMEKLCALYGITGEEDYQNESIFNQLPLKGSEKYHILKAVKQIGTSAQYINIYNEFLIADIAEYEVLGETTVIGFIENTRLDDTNYQFFFKPINQFLEEKGLEDLKKDKYTQQEIDNIYQYLNQEKLNLSLK